MYEGCELTIHLYKKPKTTKISKFLVQGGTHMAKYIFVFTELPIIYKKVCDAKPAKIEQNIERMNNQSGVTCDKCKFKSNSMILMKKHIRTIHNPRRSQGSKRISSFTPITKPSKKTKNNGTPRSNIFLMAEGIADESAMTLDDTFAGVRNQLTLEETSSAKTATQRTNTSEHLVKEHCLFSCTNCEYDSENEEDMRVHEKKHIQNQCSCHALEEDIVLKEHSNECKALEIIERDDINKPDNEKRYDCIISPSETQENDQLQESVVICGNCGKGCESMENYEEHDKICHVPVQSLECEIFREKLPLKGELADHIEKQHAPENNKCNICEVTSETKSKHDEHLRLHTQNSTNPKNIDCYKCKFKCQDTKLFIKHLLDVHGENSEVIQCPHCDFNSIDMTILDSHIENKHVELALLGNITENQAVLAQKCGILETKLINMVNNILDSHNQMKQEMFILRQNYSASNEKLERIENALNNMMTNKVATNTRVEAYRLIQYSSEKICNIYN